MRATVMYGAHDVRVETVPDAKVVEPTDALVRVTSACICGSEITAMAHKLARLVRRSQVDDHGERLRGELRAFWTAIPP